MLILICATIRYIAQSLRVSITFLWFTWWVRYNAN